MAHESIQVLGYRTGASVLDGKVYNDVAFDLRDVLLEDRLVSSVAVRLGAGETSGSPVLVTLLDPSHQTAYGRSRRVPRRGVVRIPLTRAALGDLQQAAGGFFDVAVTVEDARGELQRLGDPSSTQILTMAAREARVVRAAA